MPFSQEVCLLNFVGLKLDWKAFDSSPACFDSKITQGGGDRLLKDSEPANLSSHYFFKGQGKLREDIVCVVLCV